MLWLKFFLGGGRKEKKERVKNKPLVHRERRKDGMPGRVAMDRAKILDFLCQVMYSGSIPHI